MRISELSAATGVSPRSLRYYEQRGLITAERLPNSYREYGPDAVAAVRTIRALLDLGLPLDLVRDVQPCTMADPDARTLTATDVGTVAGPTTCDDIVTRVTQIRDEIADRIANLSRTHDLLTSFLEHARDPR